MSERPARWRHPPRRSRPALPRGQTLLAAALMATAQVLGSGVTGLGQSPTGSSAASPGAPSAPIASPAASGAPASPSAAAPVDPRDEGFEVVFGEFAITLEAPAIRPGPVTFVVFNAGELVHGFEMVLDEDRSGRGGGSDGDDRFKLELDTFSARETVTFETDLEPGTYKIECYVADHSDRGMEVLLEVREDAPLVTPAPPAPPTEARIAGFEFLPPVLEVPVGATVTWTNEDPDAHTVTASDGSFTSTALETGATFEHTFEAPGTVRYQCAIHSGMSATVEVT